MRVCVINVVAVPTCPIARLDLPHVWGKSGRLIASFPTPDFGCFPILKTNGTAYVNLLVFKVFYPKFYFKIAHVVSNLWSKN